MIYSIQLFGDELDEVYCGCWFVPCESTSLETVVLNGRGFGLFMAADGSSQRAFFFDDELEVQLEQAERVTDCYARAVPATRVASSVALELRVAS